MNELMPGKAAIALVKDFEGCAKKRRDGRLQAYPDPGTGHEPWTIGWGSTGPDIVEGTIWTQDQADKRLELDLRNFASGVREAIGPVPTSQSEFDAMLSLAYNVGLANFRKSTLLKKHKANDKAAAAAEFAKWNKAAGKVMAGLTRRREAEAALYRGERR